MSDDGYFGNGHLEESQCIMNTCYARSPIAPVARAKPNSSLSSWQGSSLTGYLLSVKTFVPLITYITGIQFASPETQNVSFLLGKSGFQ